MTPIYCRSCDNVHPATRGDDPWRWRCMKVPVPSGYRFVDPEYAPNPPYEVCGRVNTDGACSLFTPIPQPEETQPKTRQYQQHKRIIEATQR